MCCPFGGSSVGAPLSGGPGGDSFATRPAGLASRVAEFMATRNVLEPPVASRCRPAIQEFPGTGVVAHREAHLNFWGDLWLGGLGGWRVAVGRWAGRRWAVAGVGRGELGRWACARGGQDAVVERVVCWPAGDLRSNRRMRALRTDGLSWAGPWGEPVPVVRDPGPPWCEPVPVVRAATALQVPNQGTRARFSTSGAKSALQVPNWDPEDRFVTKGAVDRTGAWRDSGIKKGAPSKRAPLEGFGHRARRGYGYQR